MSNWVYWKEQCTCCANRNNVSDGKCSYPETKKAIKDLQEWERSNKFYGTLSLRCAYFFPEEKAKELHCCE